MNSDSLIWVESDPDTQFTLLASTVTESESLVIGGPDNASNDLLYGVSHRGRKQYRLKSLIATTVDAGGLSTAGQGIDFIFCHTDAYVGTTMATATGIGQVNIPLSTSNWVDLGNNIWQWYAHDIDLSVFDSENAKTEPLFPRIHITAIAGTGDLTAGAFRLTLGFLPLS